MWIRPDRSLRLDAGALHGVAPRSAAVPHDLGHLGRRGAGREQAHVEQAFLALARLNELADLGAQELVALLLGGGELLDHLDNKRTADAGRIVVNPTSTYTDPALAEREWETFFKNHPQVLGMSGELPKHLGASLKRELIAFSFALVAIPRDKWRSGVPVVGA